MKGLALLLSLALLVLSSGCRPAARVAGPMQLTATIAPAGDILARLAGEEAEVTTLLPQGASPENYEPTTQDVRALTESKGFFYVGDLGFERSWVERIKTQNPELKLYRLDAGLEAKASGHSHGTDGLVHDPHYWTSVRGLRALASAALVGLVELNPLDSARYSERHQELTAQLDALQTELEATLRGRSSSAFVIYHPSLSEFAEEWGFTQLVVEEDGKEPSPRHVAEIVAKARAAGVRVVFVQQEFDSKIVQSIAQELGARTVTIRPLSADWQGELRRIAQALAEH
nr:zinc ABC transporter substrate-binding protein [uncultured Porphyromonas sp.]